MCLGGRLYEGQGVCVLGGGCMRDRVCVCGGEVV